DGGAVLGRDIAEIDHGADAAGTRHVLHHDIGLARNVGGEIGREHMRVARIAAAGAGRKDPVDGFALVEVLDRVGGRGGAERNECSERSKRNARVAKARAPTFPPPLWGRDRERGGDKHRIRDQRLAEERPTPLSEEFASTLRICIYPSPSPTRGEGTVWH